jgi:hypothetical protein
MDKIGTLWRGDLPLSDAFWTWAVLGGLVVNIATSVPFLALMTAGLTAPAFVVGYGLSLPYNLVALVGVFRSADRHPGPGLEADLARLATLVLIAVLSLT